MRTYVELVMLNYHAENPLSDFISLAAQVVDLPLQVTTIFVTFSVSCNTFVPY